MKIRRRKLRCWLFGHKPAPATVYRNLHWHEITSVIRYCARCGHDMSFLVPSRYGPAQDR